MKNNLPLKSIGLLVVMLLLTLPSFALTGPGASWQYVRKLTLSPVIPSANFQMKVTLTTAALGNPYTNIKSDGSDLRFYDGNNNVCNYWIESWNNSGNSTIWVRVPTSGANAIYMFYGNSGASAVSNGANVFDFFDDFPGSSLAGNWATETSSGTIGVSGGWVTLSNTNNGSNLTISSAFTPSSTSFYIEVKHKEGSYFRNRFYAAATSLGSSPTGFDYGYFVNGGQAQIYWNGIWTGAAVTANTDYLTRWQITDGSTYNWSNYTYPAMTQVDTRSTTLGTNIRYLSVKVTEQSGTSTKVDWVRVRKYVASEPAATIGSQLNTLTASIGSKTDVVCYGQSTGSATASVTGGSTPYTYVWSNSQTGVTATGLATGNYTYTVTESAIGLQSSASVTITQPTPLTASSNSPVCTGATLNLSTASGVSYSWSGPNSFTSSVQNPSIAGATAASAGTYNVTVVDNNGCTNNASTAVTVNPLPTITTSASAAAACFSAGSQNTTLAYSATTNSPTNYTITWDAVALAAGLQNLGSTALPVSPVTVPVAAGVVAGTYNGTIKVTNANGCESTGNSFTMTINPAPSITSASTGTICSGQAQNYTITSSMPATYSWSRNAVSGISNGTISGQTSNPVTESLVNTSNAAVNVTYTITATSGGCTGSTFNYVVTVSPSLAWYNSNWQYRKSITIDHTKVPNTDQTDFPVLVNRNSDADLQVNALSTGNDILFTSADGVTKIPYQREYYNSSDGALTAWVKVPTVSASQNTTIYMYYGNPNASDQQSASTVWDANYAGVYHLTENSTSSGAYKESKSGTINGTVAEQVLKTVFNMNSSGGNDYHYRDLSDITDYAITSGDRLVYDVYWTSSSDLIAFDLTTTGGTLRDAGVTDQNGIAAHPNGALSSYALNKWYHREIPIPAGLVGKVIQYYDLACEHDGGGTQTAYFNNIYIMNGTSITKVIYASNTSITTTTHLNNPGSNTASVTRVTYPFTSRSGSGKISSSSNAALNSSGARYLDMTSSLTSVVNNFTLQAWVNPSVLTQHGYFLYNGRQNSGYGLGIGDGSGGAGSKLIGLYGDAGSVISTYTFPSTSTWYHVALVRNSGTTSFYVNGVAYSASSGGGTTPGTPNSSSFTIGAELIGLRPFSYFNGSIDEVRVSTGVRNADWIATEYNNQNSPSTFYSISAEQTNPVSSLTAAICTGNTFTVTPVGMPSGTVYTWTAPAISPSGSITGSSAENSGQASISQTLTNTISSAATATYTVTPAVGSCPSGSTFPLVVTVNPLPEPVVTASGDTTFCQGNSVVLNPSTGTALSLNGSNQYLRTPDLTSSFGSSTVTIELWFRANAAGIILDELGQTTPNSGWHDSWIEVLSTGQVKARVWQLASPFLSLGTVTFGTWNHVVIRYNGTNVVGFLNGVKSSAVAISRQTPPVNGTSPNNKQYWAVGTSDGTNMGSSAWFNGQVDEMRIWNVSRSDAQVAASWNTTVPANSTGLVAYYKMDDGSGSSLADASGNGNTGVLVNSPTWVNPSTAPISYYSSYLWSPGGVTTSANTITASGNYTVNVTDANGCSVNTTPKTVTVNAIPSATATNNNQSVCSGNSIAPISLGTSNNVTGTTFNWTRTTPSGISGTVPVSATGSMADITGTLSNSNSSSVTVTFTITPYGPAPTNCQGSSISASVVVYPASVGGTVSVSGNSTICYGTNKTLNLTGYTGTIVKWQSSIDGGVNWSDIANTTASYTATNLIATTQFRAVVQSGVCPAANSTAATVTVNPPPAIVINTNYCGVGGNVQLTSNSFSSYSWSTGATTQSITVDLAGIYALTVTDALGCTNENAVTVATELVTNGKFESGNTGFTTGYNYTSEVYSGGGTGLTPEGRYTVASNASTYHPIFFAKDHTNPGTGKFMIINGAISPSYTTVWTQDITVQPYTDYYFSAFAISLNQVAPYGQLQFKVNGEQVGTVAMLSQGAASDAGPFNWVRFYGTWNSGPITSTTLSIVDLQTAAGGNDFGLDDISCSTLAPLTFSIAPAGLNSLVCEGNDIELAANVAGGKAPFTYSWSGPNSFASSASSPTISNATPAMSGTYNLTVTNGYGCSASGSTAITIGSLPSDRTVTAVSSEICSGAATSISIASSESGVKYQLRNNADSSNIGSPVTGNGGTINLPTGNLSSATTFNVLATNASTFCSRQLNTTPTVTIATTPVLVITNQAACSGTVDLSAPAVTAGSSGGGTLSYWTDVAATNSLSNYTAVNTSGTYYIKSTVGSCYDIEPVAVTISSTPKADFSYTATPYCSSASDPSPTFNNGGTAGTFSSTSGLVFVSISTGQVDLSASTPGTYTVTNTIAAGCTTVAKTSSIVITQLPSAEFNYGTNSLCQNASGSNPYPTFINGGVAGTFTSSYGLNIINANTGQINILGSTPGNYAVVNTIAAAGGCGVVKDTAFIYINPYSFTGSVSDSSSTDVICNGQSFDLFSSSTQYRSALLKEGFNSNLNSWTVSNSSTGGTPANAAWTLRPDNYTYVISGTTNKFNSNDASQFYLSNSHSQGGGNTVTVLQSPVMNTTGYTSLALDFFQYFRKNGNDTLRVQVSTNGSSWTTVKNYTTNQGTDIGTNPVTTIFANSYVDLSGYINKPTFYVRFRYKASSGYFLAIDNISVTGYSTKYTYNWTSTPGGFTSSNQNPTGVSPITNTSYTVVATNTYGCTASTDPVAIVVNPVPIDNSGSDKSICNGSNVSIGAGNNAGRTYSWSPSGSLNNQTLSNPTASPTVTTTYTLTETITATGCSAANDVVVAVNPLPEDKTLTPVAAVVCSGSSTSIQVLNSAIGVSYQLRNDIDDSPIGSAVEGNTNTILLPTQTLNSNTTYNVYATVVSPNTGCATQLSTTPTVSIASPGMWVGLYSSNWNDINNWCDTVPKSTTDVVIPAGTPYSPVISSDALCRNLTINSGNSLTITLNGNLSLYGNLTVNGTYSHTAGLLQLKGSSNQTIDAISAFNINVNTDNIVTLNGNLTVTGTLTLTKGVVTTGTDSVIISNPAFNSVLADVSNTNYSVSWINGNIKRNFTNNSWNSYDFPVGTATKGRLASVKSNGLDGISSFTAYFKNGPVATGGNNANQYINAWETGLPGDPFHTPYVSIRDEGSWIIEPNVQPNTNSYDIRIYFNGFISPSLIDNQFGILKRPVGSQSFADFKPGGGTINASGGAGRLVSNGYALRMGLTSFSEFAIGESGRILPIELTSFTAEKYNNDKDALLKWHTASELNNDHFDVEVAGGIVTTSGELEFRKIGEVKGNNTSAIEHNYSFVDRELNKAGVRYYRLRQVDIDGTVSFSEIRAVEFSNNDLALTAVYPNPATDRLTVSTVSSEVKQVTVTVNDILGRVITEQEIKMQKGTTLMNIDVSGLPQGVYFLNIISSGETTIHKKFEKF